MAYKITKASADYTGGGCWVITGKINDNYFIADNNISGVNRCVTIVNANPANLDESLDIIWQEKYLISYVGGHEAEQFYNSLVEYLLTADNEERGGITDIEIERMRRD